MAYWGEAMTYIHPLWSDPPTDAGFDRGRMLALRAAQLASGNAVDSAFASAAAAYYLAGRETSVLGARRRCLESARPLVIAATHTRRRPPR